MVVYFCFIFLAVLKYGKMAEREVFFSLAFCDVEVEFG